MNDERKTKRELIDELAAIRRRVVELEALETEYKRAKSEQKAAHKLLQAAIDAVKEPIMLIDADYRVKLMNQNVRDNYLGSREADNAYCYEISHQRDTPCNGTAHPCPLKEVYKSLHPVTVVHEHIQHTGQKCCVEIMASPLFGEDGKLIGIVETIRDVTERIQIEETLRESEERYKRLVGSVTDYIYTVKVEDNRPVTTFHSPACTAVTGYTSEEYQSDPHLWDRKIYEADRPAVAKQIAGTLLGEDGPPLEHRIIHKDGSIRWVRNTPVPRYDECGRLISFDGLIADITARKQTEETLKQRNRELALLDRVGRTFSSTLDLDQVLITILEEVRRLLDVAACSLWLIDTESGELVCQQANGPQSEVVRGWRLPPGQGVAGWVARNGKGLIVPDTKIDTRHFKGVDKQIGLAVRSILSVPLRVKEQVIGALQMVDSEINHFTAADMTLLESLAGTAGVAIENARLYEQARQDAKTKAVLLDEVNHRVKNNLAAIIGLLYVERRHAEVKEETVYQAGVDDLINRIYGLSVVHRLLSASEWSPLPLSELTSRVIDAAVHVTPPYKRISIDVSPSTVHVTSKQANSLALVINELATNTAKYALDTDEISHITVRITLEDNPGSAGHTILFEFRDDGPGYPEEVLQLERHNVGMYLVQTFVRDGLRGELTLNNQLGAVTTIRFPAME